MPKPTYDKLTPDHQPQAALVTFVADLKSDGKLLFKDRRVRTTIAPDRAARGVAINLHVLRHYETRTYGTPVSEDVKSRIRKNVNEKKTDDARRAAVIGVVEEELGHDIDKVKGSLGQPAVWADLDEVFDVKKSKPAQKKTAQKKRDAVQEEISKRIVAGERQVAAQDLRQWSAEG
jgi:hypothetical protein